MSGRRTKALRRELLKDLGRAPLETKWHNRIRLEHGEGEKTVTPNSGLRRFFLMKPISRIKKVVGWFATDKQTAHSEVVIGNEFRRYKREWKRRRAA